MQSPDIIVFAGVKVWSVRDIDFSRNEVVKGLTFPSHYYGLITSLVYHSGSYLASCLDQHIR